MKLRKQELISTVKDSLLTMGYKEFKDSRLGTSGLFCRYVGDSYFLTLGLEIRSLYDCRYTASFYFSKTTRWASLGYDIPKKCFQRIGQLLTNEEKRRYFGDNLNMMDKWWSSIDAEEVNDFLTTIKKTQNRIIEDLQLRQAIGMSKEINRQCQVVELIQKRVLDSYEEDREGFDFKFIPKHTIDAVPMIWFKAAEYVRRYEVIQPTISKNWVILDAADAYRQHTLLSDYK